MTCSISGLTNGTYVGVAYNTRTSVGEKVVDNLIIQKVRNIVAGIGIDGLIWTIFFIMGIVMLGLFKPAAAIVFAIGGLIMVSLLGLASIPWLSLIAIIFAGLILLWELRQ